MQTRFGHPEGDCLMACVATVTGIPLEDLPDLHEEAKRQEKGWWWILLLDLAERGWLVLRYDQVGSFPAVVPRGVVIAGGTSPREAFDEDGLPVRHSVVYLDGELYHDPHPSGDGLLGEPDAWTVLVPLMGPTR